jgi:hypothetical protein
MVRIPESEHEHTQPRHGGKTKRAAVDGKVNDEGVGSRLSWWVKAGINRQIGKGMTRGKQKPIRLAGSAAGSAAVLPGRATTTQPTHLLEKGRRRVSDM